MLEFRFPGRVDVKNCTPQLLQSVRIDEMPLPMEEMQKEV